MAQIRLITVEIVAEGTIVMLRVIAFPLYFNFTIPLIFNDRHKTYLMHFPDKLFPKYETVALKIKIDTYPNEENE